MDASTFDIDGLVHAILTCVTAGPGLGFNRAVLFLPNDAGDALVATMAIGPASPEEAQRTWERLASAPRSLGELLGRRTAEPRSGLSALVEGLAIRLASNDGRNPLVEAYYARETRKIVDAHTLDGLPTRLREAFAGTEVVCVPLLAKNRAIGLLIADNAFNREPIDDGRVRLLELLAVLSGLALDNARIYQHVQSQAEALERALAELGHTHERLLHAERLATIGAVIARVGHEIRNPLTTIGGFARKLGARPEDMQRVARGASIIVEEVEKLEVLLRELLDFTSPHAPSFAPTDVNALVTQLADVHREHLGGRVELVLDLARHVPMIEADALQLQRTCLNLWRNAVQAMEDNPPERPRVLTIRSRETDDGVTIEIADTGPGVDPAIRAQMFAPFATTKRQGTGLGLAVVRKIVDDHGGTIEVGAPRDGGATFTIALPRRRS